MKLLALRGGKRVARLALKPTGLLPIYSAPEAGALFAAGARSGASVFSENPKWLGTPKTGMPRVSAVRMRR